jgi:hypothetical protein
LTLLVLLLQRLTLLLSSYNHHSGFIPLPR